MEGLSSDRLCRKLIWRVFRGLRGDVEILSTKKRVTMLMNGCVLFKYIQGQPLVVIHNQYPEFTSII